MSCFFPSGYPSTPIVFHRNSSSYGRGPANLSRRRHEQQQRQMFYDVREVNCFGVSFARVPGKQTNKTKQNKRARGRPKGAGNSR